MEVSGTNIGASTFAMKKAMEMPNLMIDLIKNSATSDKQSLAAEQLVSPTQAPGLSSVTGKGRIIDLVA